MGTIGKITSDVSLIM